MDAPDVEVILDLINLQEQNVHKEKDIKLTLNIPTTKLIHQQNSIHTSLLKIFINIWDSSLFMGLSSATLDLWVSMQLKILVGILNRWLEV